MAEFSERENGTPHTVALISDLLGRLDALNSALDSENVRLLLDPRDTIPNASQ